jgi:hypothetical protein
LNSPKQFAKVATGEKTKEVRKVFGPGAFDINKEMGEGFTPVVKAAGDVMRDIRMTKEAEAGTQALKLMLEDKSIRARLPSFFNKWVTAANKGLDIAESGMDKKTMKALVEGMKSGKNFSDLLDTLPTWQKNKFLKAMVEDAGSAGKYTAANVSGAANQVE